MFEALHFEFMRNALLAGILVSVACGVIGSLVVVNRIVFISGGIAHAAYGGIGLAFYLGLPPTFGAAAFSVIVAITMGIVSLKGRHRADTIIGVMWALGMALGIILIDVTPGYNVDLMSYLFGSILSVPSNDIWFMLGLDILMLVFVLAFYRALIAMSYDEEFAFVVGIAVKALYFTMLMLIALSVVMIIRVVGLILVIALLTIPPFVAEKYTNSLGKMMILAALLGVIFNMTGLWLSFQYNLTSGATIILVAGLAFFLSVVWDTIRGKKRIGRRSKVEG
jgi:zinc transport system permease protein